MMRKDRKFRIYAPGEIDVRDWDIKGKEYLEIMKKIERIIRYQQRYGVKKGIKGFVFYGDVGLGKTTMAKAIAYKLGAYLIFVDGKDIARPLYGESESQIGEIFEEAKKLSRMAIVLIDDCESVFPSRDWSKGAAWHVAQNNVFFHELDSLDTSKVVVILTTNRYDLLDKAIKDRLVNIEFPKPSKETLREILEEKRKELKIKDISLVMAEIEEGRFTSVRALEKRLMEVYLQQIWESEI